MFRTGDVEPLRGFSLESCPCRQITRSVARVIRNGGKYEGSRYRVVSLRVHDIRNKTAAVEVTALVPPYKVVNGSGDVIEDSPGGRLHTDFSLSIQGERWVVTNAVNLG
jgi:hypothetical protein